MDKNLFVSLYFFDFQRIHQWEHVLFEIALRARSALLCRSELAARVRFDIALPLDWILRTHLGLAGAGRSNPLSLAVSLEFSTRSRSVPMRRANWPLKNVHNRRVARNGRSKLFLDDRWIYNPFPSWAPPNLRSNDEMRCNLCSQAAQSLIQPSAHKLFEHYFLRFPSALHWSQGITSQQARRHNDLRGNVRGTSLSTIFPQGLMHFIWTWPTIIAPGWRSLHAELCPATIALSAQNVMRPCVHFNIFTRHSFLTTPVASIL